jgi:hypothetical protein
VIDVYWTNIPAGSSIGRIRWARSVDGGSTWTSQQDIVTNATYSQSLPSATLDPNTGDKYVLFQGRTSGTYDQVRRVKYTAATSTWGAATDMTTNTTGHAQNPAVLWSMFNMNSSDAVRWIYTDAQAVSTKFDSFSINVPPLAPSALTRANFDKTTSAVFSWTFNDTTGDTQSAYELEIYDTAAPSTPVVKVAKTGSTVSSHTLAANTLTNGITYQWRVLTYDAAGFASPWSAYSTFKCSAAPTVTAVAPASISSDSYTFGGTYSQGAGSTQTSFQFKLYDAAGTTILQDSGTILSKTNAYTFAGLANNTTYQVEFTATSQDGVSATSAKKTFSVAYTPPFTPVVTATSDGANARNTVTFSNPVTTTNLLRNSGAEVATGTAQVFNDNLTSGAAWAVRAGDAFSFAAGGATIGTAGSRMSAGNAVWVPLTGSGGQNLALTAQVTLTTNSSNGFQYLALSATADLSSCYRAYLTATAFRIEKVVPGSTSILGTPAVVTTTASTVYTITLSRDTTGQLTAKLYSGSTSTGTPLQTITVTDTALSGGFLIGVGGDAGVVFKDASVSAPMADSWAVYTSQGAAAIALDTDAKIGTYAISTQIANVATSHGIQSGFLPVSAGVQYTASIWIKGTAGKTVTLRMQAYNGASYLTDLTSPTVTLTGAWQQATCTAIMPATTTQVKLQVRQATTGNFAFKIDAGQVETGAAFTTYVRNDNVSQSASNAPTVTRNDVYRRKLGETTWRLVAASATSPYVDYLAPAGTYEYAVAAISASGSVSAYGTAQTALSFSGSWLIDESAVTAPIVFQYNSEGNSIDFTQNTTELRTKATLPRLRREITKNHAGTLAGSFFSSDTDLLALLTRLETMASAGTVYLLKTPIGRVFGVALRDLHTEETFSGRVLDVSLKWTEVKAV